MWGVGHKLVEATIAALVEKGAPRVVLHTASRVETRTFIKTMLWSIKSLVAPCPVRILNARSRL